MKPVTLVAILATSLASAAHANVIVNGGFEAGVGPTGEIGFSSGYAYQQDQIPASTVYVGTNPNADNPSFSAFAAHGGSNMFIANGSGTAGVQVWGETGLAVQAGTTYFFSTWIASATSENPAQLAFSINGAQVGSVFDASATTGLWQQFYVTWNSGSATSATVSLVNEDTALSGNDFALDDIVLDTTSPVPEPASLALLACGLAALAAVTSMGAGPFRPDTRLRTHVERLVARRLRLRTR